jgi:hypothetical protein
VKTKRMTEITVETDEVFVIRRLGSSVAARCVECGERVSMVTAEEAARLTGLGWREIARRVETGGVHFLETTDGQLLICIDSLSE